MKDPCYTPLEAVGVSVLYRGSDHPALSDLALGLPRGYLTSVLGPNGAGKSTLVRVLAGTLRPTRGFVRLEGQDLQDMDRRLVARRIAVVPQDVRVAFGFRVRDVVMMGRAPHQGTMLASSRHDREVVDAILERTDLIHLADRVAGDLSGGEQKLVAIARALAQRPEILLLDEATAHLDIRHVVAVHKLVRREICERHIACLAIMHDLNEAAQHADRVVLMNQGAVVAQGTVPEVMTYRILRETFGVDLYVGLNEVDGTRYYVPMRDKQDAS